jgi:2,3,4,5-tetrahydropyridine-2-carboxylate N-succinyltransferase
MEALRGVIEGVFEDRSRLADPASLAAIHQVMDLLDSGKLRVAEPPAEDGGAWTVNAWAKQAVLLYFRHQRDENFGGGTL